jgi:hypothetical protein
MPGHPEHINPVIALERNLDIRPIGHDALRLPDPDRIIFMHGSSPKPPPARAIEHPESRRVNLRSITHVAEWDTL